MKKTILSVMALLALTKVNFAETVPLEKAKAVATSFFSNTMQNNDASKSATPEMKLVYTENFNLSKKTEPAYYIFNNSNGAGFVIIAGDDAVDPIIGYSLENKINVNDLPSNFVSFMEAQKYRIVNVRKNNLRSSTETEAKWNTNTRSSLAASLVVTPLIKAIWGQGSPYNQKCPKKDGENTLVGCTAVAMGQIMNYWHYPTKGSGTHGGVDFGNTTYDWANMPNSISNTSSTAQKNAISTLLYHCGVSVDMKYGLKASGAFLTAGSFEKYFKYDAEAKLVHYYDYTTDKWIDLLKEELNNYRPVAYSGWAEKEGVVFPDYEKGHTWVVDGYDSQNKFHMNWGWNGKTGANADGFYQITDLEPKTNEYQYQNQAIIGLQNPNRLALSNISTTKSLICSKTSFVCSVTENTKIAAYLWTVPKGWSVSGVVSDGTPQALGRSVTIVPPSDAAVTAQSTILITVRGITTYGERTLDKSISIATGKPSFTKKTVIYDIGSAYHCFEPSKGASMQIFEAGVWKNWSGCIELFNGAKKTITVRASNSCGLSGAQTFSLTSPIDPDNKREASSIDEKSTLSFILSPNPASDNVFIQTHENIQSVKCLNTFGQVVDVKLSDNSISVSHLPKGIYFLSLTTEDGSTEIKKFIKE